MKDTKEIPREMTAEERAKYLARTSRSSNTLSWKYEREKETSVKIKVKQVESAPVDTPAPATQ